MSAFKRILKIFIASIIAFVNINILIIKKLFNNKLSKILIFYYHGMNEYEFEKFKVQVKFLSKFGQFISPHETNNNYKIFNFLLTFDDGLESTFKFISPFLSSKKIPHIIFIPTGYFNKIPDWHIDSMEKKINEKVISKEELQSFDFSFCIIGSHTVTHRKLTLLKNGAVFKELQDSKQTLENILKTKIYYLSFPYGVYDENIISIAHKVGYKKVFSIEHEFVDEGWEGYKLGRIILTPYDWSIEILLKILGGYNWIK